MRCENCEHTIPLSFAPDKRNAEIIHTVILEADADAISEDFFDEWAALPWEDIGLENVDAPFLATQFGITEELATRLFGDWSDWLEYCREEDVRLDGK